MGALIKPSSTLHWWSASRTARSSVSESGGSSSDESMIPVVEGEREQLDLVREGAVEPLGQVVGAHVTHQAGVLFDCIGPNWETRQHHPSSLRAPRSPPLHAGNSSVVGVVSACFSKSRARALPRMPTPPSIAA